MAWRPLPICHCGSSVIRAHRQSKHVFSNSRVSGKYHVEAQPEPEVLRGISPTGRYIFYPNPKPLSPARTHQAFRRPVSYAPHSNSAETRSIFLSGNHNQLFGFGLPPAHALIQTAQSRSRPPQSSQRVGRVLVAPRRAAVYAATVL
jgi:hypothetical protein